MQKFMCTMVPGFEKVVVNELNRKFKNISSIQILRGKVLFCCNVTKEELMTLDCVDNIYYYIKTLSIGPHKKDLESFYQDMKCIKFKDAINYLGLKKTPHIIVSTSKKGKQTYSRFDVSECATKAFIEANKYKRGEVENHNLPIRIDVNNTECMISVQITPAEFKYRGSTYEFMPGGIRPTIASALIQLGNPNPDDVFYDPFCGSGTIPKERARYKARRIIASDINPVAVESARKNVPDSVKVFCCDARHMKAADRSVDMIVSNIPWGKQIVVEDILGLYTAFLTEAQRVLSMNGRMVLLTDREEIVEAAESTNFRIEKLHTISLHGLLVGVYSLKR